jgi:hypothetical protein
MKIKCINTNNHASLTVNKEYDFLGKSKDIVCIIDDLGNKNYYPEGFFVDVNSDRKIRLFPTGAIRSDNTGRERYDFISPLALKELAQFLATTENSFAQINYFLGIPEEACLESMLRHINDYRINGHKQEAVAMLFNAVALVHTIALRERNEYKEIYKETKLITQEEYEKIQINQESSQKG